MRSTTQAFKSNTRFSKTSPKRFDRTDSFHKAPATQNQVGELKNYRKPPSEDEVPLTPKSRKWAENEKMLAFKLSRQKLTGKEGLQYVLCEIVKAQKLGKIKPPEYKKLNKFALCLRKNIGMKLSKQDRDNELIKVISSKRTEILKRLLKDNIFEQEDQLEVRIEKVFDKVAKSSKQHLETYF